MTTSPETPSSDNDQQRESEPHLLDEVRDAAKLLRFAVETGRTIPEDAISAIKAAECKTRDTAKLAEFLSSKDELVDFEVAYSKLARTMHPIRAATLWSTSRERRDGTTSGRSESESWALKLWGITFIVLLIILIGELVDNMAISLVSVDNLTEAELIDSGTMSWIIVSMALAFVVPFAWGGLGACAYLLRSCHKAIHQRTFDVKRLPEYSNRILLGFVSGGAILLFYDSLDVGDGALHLGGPALAFLAGYSTDFLFTTIERIMAAIFPKVQPQRPPEDRGSEVAPQRGPEKVASTDPARGC